MPERPGAATGDGEAPAGPTDAVRAQILATEHWSLLATRSMVWNEAFSRASIFLTVLSASVVALALVAQAGGHFRAFALALLPVVLFLGLATFGRLTSINEEDGRLLIAMNLLRHGYLDIAPDLEPYFMTGHYDDIATLLETAQIGAGLRRRFPLQALVSTPSVVAVIDAVIAGFICGLLAQAVNASAAVSRVAGVLGALVLLGMLTVVPARQITRFVRTHQPRFPRER